MTVRCPDCGAQLDHYRHFCDTCRDRRKRVRRPGRPPPASREVYQLAAYGLTPAQFDAPRRTTEFSKTVILKRGRAGW